jgi:lysophospholipase-1
VAGAGVPPDRVVLAGFSQGGALSLFAGLNFGGSGGGAAGAAAGGAAAGGAAGAHLGGIAVLSGYLPMPSKVVPNPHVLARTHTVFFHGDEDAVVPLTYAEDAHKRLQVRRLYLLAAVRHPAFPIQPPAPEPPSLQALGAASLRFHTFEGLGHGAHDEELEMFAAWLAAI